jgi:hypothetical protein
MHNHQITKKRNMNTHRIINRTMLAMLAGGLCVWAVGQFTPVQAAKATRVVDAIWVHDTLYGTVGTDTAFKSPPAHSTDVIFSFADSGLLGQRSVAVYAPGDPEYNGGRWNVMVATFTDSGKALFDPDGDGTVNMELTNAEDLVEAVEMGYLTIAEAGVYFECPLLPQRNRR